MSKNVLQKQWGTVSNIFGQDRLNFRAKRFDFRARQFFVVFMCKMSVLEVEEFSGRTIFIFGFGILNFRVWHRELSGMAAPRVKMHDQVAPNWAQNGNIWCIHILYLHMLWYIHMLRYICYATYICYDTHTHAMISQLCWLGFSCLACFWSLGGQMVSVEKANTP